MFITVREEWNIKVETVREETVKGGGLGLVIGNDLSTFTFNSTFSAFQNDLGWRDWDE